MLKTVSLICYWLPANTSDPPIVVNYTRQAQNLSFSTVAPGGYGQLTVDIYLGNIRLPRPELAMFSYVAVLDGPLFTGRTYDGAHAYVPSSSVLFLGEILESTVTYDNVQGTYLTLTGLGIGNGLRDDPASTSYTTQTAQQIATAQFTLGNRSHYLPIDSDTSQVFPDNPAGTFSPVYQNKTMEEVIADVAILAGDYHWGVWAHAINRDKAGFPTGQLYVHPRDATTIHYRASLSSRQVRKYKVPFSADRAYNVIEIDYYDPVAGTVGASTYTDARLAANGSQGTAPFRRRKFVEDKSGIATVTATQAQDIANTYGMLYQNPTTKTSITLTGVADANGVEIPLQRIQANHNIAIPEMASRGTQLLTTFVGGTNLFYIVSATYHETNGDVYVDLECDNFVDSTALQLARLQLAADYAQRANKTTGSVQATGATEFGACGLTWSNGVGGQTTGIMVNFKSTMTTTPTSVTLTRLGSNNAGTATVAHITNVGFMLNVPVTANGGGYWYGTYNTVGN